MGGWEVDVDLKRVVVDLREHDMVRVTLEF